jgi:hypothetical protein
MTVRIEPLPTWVRTTKFKPLHPPVFEADDPTPDDIALALALFAELDAESLAWYGPAFADRLRAKLR